MQAVLLVIHVIIALSLIGIILIQRSDSDGFGLGSGSGANFMTGRTAANFLTRTTAILATLFILNSLILGIMASHRGSTSIADTIAAEQESLPKDEATPSTADLKKDEATTEKKDAVAKEEPAKAKPKKSEPSVPTE